MKYRIQETARGVWTLEELIPYGFFSRWKVIERHSTETAALGRLIRLVNDQERFTPMPPRYFNAWGQETNAYGRLKES